MPGNPKPHKQPIKFYYQYSSRHSPRPGSDLGFCTGLACSASAHISLSRPRHGHAALQHQHAAFPFRTLNCLVWCGNLNCAHLELWPLSLRMLQACSQCGKRSSLPQSALQTPQSALQARTHVAALQNILRCCISCKECPEIRRWCLQQNLCDYLSTEHSSQRILSSQSQQLVHPHISRSHISSW